MGKNAQRKRQEKDQRSRAEQVRIQQALLQHYGKKPASQPSPAKQMSPAPLQGLMKASANPQDIFNHLKGRTVIGFIQEAMDCCSEKCILEYTQYFNDEKYGILMIPRANYEDVLKYLCNYVVLFRTGYKEGDSVYIQNLVSYINHLRGLGIRVVYYCDDFLFYANNKAPLTLIHASDAVIVANQTLKHILTTTLNYNKPVIVVPTHINLKHFDITAPFKTLSKDRFKILLTSGGRIGINNFYEICEIANSDPDMAQNIEWIVNCQGVAEIRTIINKFRNLKKTYIDWMPLQGYYSLSKSVDLIIHPARPDDLAYMCPTELQQTWLDSKSEVKYTLAGAARIPIISSPCYAYKHAIKDGVTGFIANDTNEFVSLIKKLKDDRSLRTMVGLAARQDIEKNYDIKHRYPLYRDAIVGKVEQKATFLTMFKRRKKLLYIPPIEGGPRTFYENMKRHLPIVSKDTWDTADTLDVADAVVAVAFVLSDEILKEKAKRPSLRILYRLDGLPTDFNGGIDETNLKKMQEMFRHADKFVWQSKHCQKMWRDANFIPPEINPEGAIIHNGVDLSIFTTSSDQKYNFPNASQYNFVNLNWSTFKHKRLDLLQDFISSYADNSNIHFYLIGNYVTTNQIANMTFWKDFPNATYMGQMRNQSKEAKEVLATIYRAATALIFTSNMEGSPNTVLEAMGCGCPVIYNAEVDIVPEILSDACLPLEDVEKIFDQSVRLSLQSKMAQLAPSFSIEECVRKYLEVLS